MHKKIKTELQSLANSILQLENSETIDNLHAKAQLIYEKLTVLKFVSKNLQESDSEVIIEEKLDEKKPEVISVKEGIKKDESIEDAQNTISFSLNEELEKEKSITIESEDATEKTELKATLENEFKDAVSADVATQIFEGVTKENPIVESKKETSFKSLNDRLFEKNLQIGLNDRIAFVKHLFEGKQEDFNRVLSQLNSFDSEKEAKDFLLQMVKPDYNWDQKEEYETRLLNLIERKFL